jgi:vacuolar-type H+-ATPase subunit I/STV1
MTTPLKAIRNLGSLMFGAVLLLIGLVASFYESRYYYSDGSYTSHGYPYQTVGIILILVGIVFVGLGLFYSPRKTNDLPPPPPK